MEKQVDFVGMKVNAYDLHAMLQMAVSRIEGGCLPLSHEQCLELCVTAKEWMAHINEQVDEQLL